MDSETLTISGPGRRSQLLDSSIQLLVNHAQKEKKEKVQCVGVVVVMGFRSV